METLFDTEARKRILGRISRLEADSTRRWGTMTLGAALAHLADQLRFATGELEPRGPRGPLTWKPVQWFAIAVAPWPRGRVDTSPELLQTELSPTFEADRDELVRLIEMFSQTPAAELKPHPMFGPLPQKLWGRLALRHLDHHLKQFGV